MSAAAPASCPAETNFAAPTAKRAQDAAAIQERAVEVETGLPPPKGADFAMKRVGIMRMGNKGVPISLPLPLSLPPTAANDDVHGRYVSRGWQARLGKLALRDGRPASDHFVIEWGDQARGAG